jgi:hypothetical protein
MKHLFRKICGIILAASLILASPLEAQMRDVKLAWNPNPVTQKVTEYRLYKVEVGVRTLIGSTAETNITVQADTGWVIGVSAFSAFSVKEGELSDTVVILPPISPNPWLIASVSSEAEGNEAKNLFDGLYGTFWKSKSSENYPHSFVVDFQEFKNIKGFVYTPLQSTSKLGYIKDFQIFVSIDGQNWGDAYSGSFALIENASSNKEQVFLMSEPQVGKYLKFVALSPLNPSDTVATMAEFDIFEAPMPEAPSAPTGLQVIEIPSE